MKNVHPLREIEDVTRRCHEKLLEIVTRNCHKTVGQIACFFWVSFFLMTKDRRGLWVSQRSQSAECKCKKLLWRECFRFDELYGAMFWLQKSSITTPCHSFVRKWSRNVFLLKLDTGIETYYIIWSHVSTSLHTSLTLSNELYFETQMVIFQNHILKWEKNLGESHQTRDKTFKRENRGFERKFFW